MLPRSNRAEDVDERARAILDRIKGLILDGKRAAAEHKRLQHEANRAADLVIGKENEIGQIDSKLKLAHNELDALYVSIKE